MAKAFGDKLRDNLLDAMDAAYWEEHDRWHVQRKMGGGYELVRTLNAEDEEVTNLTKRDLHSKELSPRQMAGSWLKTYRGRAAMQAAVRMK